MLNFSGLPPLSLYIHLPWCVKKCPYCDFNSHQLKASLPEKAYVAALLADFKTHLPFIQNRPIQTIFFGGGTPSLFSGHAIQTILQGIRDQAEILDPCEITLEANPGTVDNDRFEGFREAGINRLSIGIQSLQPDKLIKLGRIHNQASAFSAIQHAKAAGFTNFNLDIMYGLPEQTLEDSITDIQLALETKPTHFSWYQLTIEPNTLFHHKPPILPDDELIWAMQNQGMAKIEPYGLKQYEVSAFARFDSACQHNLNYWTFGDYLGIGAGAHSKITLADESKIIRFSQVKHPQTYLSATSFKPLSIITLNDEDITFEFMLNALRLSEGVSYNLFEARSGLSRASLIKTIKKAQDLKLLKQDDHHILPTSLGKRFLNDLVGLFLPK